MTDRTHRGVLAPVVTPFDADLAPDVARWLAQCRWLLSQDCGLAIFGTNSEANSMSVAERRALLAAAVEGGLDPARMMPGTGACAIPDAAELAKAAVEAGCGGVLMLPPFYYKGVSDDGLFAFYSEVIQRVGHADLRIYLYHIPQVSNVPIPLGLIERLLAAYPGTVAGIKDSSGEWENMRAMIEGFAEFDVFAGSEELLLEVMRAGGAGCISATANIAPAAIHALFAGWRADDAADRQARITAFRRALLAMPMIPGIKAAIGICTGDMGWARVRPPLIALDETRKAELAALLAAAAFEMPGRVPAA